MPQVHQDLGSVTAKQGRAATSGSALECLGATRRGHRLIVPSPESLTSRLQPCQCRDKGSDSKPALLDTRPYSRLSISSHSQKCCA